MLEDGTAQWFFSEVFRRDRDMPVAAVCHGVLLAAQAKDPGTGRSVLHGRRATALTSLLELRASMCCPGTLVTRVLGSWKRV
ncbi:hypothetical protein ACFWW8_37205, partial [Streptomyces sp. NPDC058701]